MRRIEGQSYFLFLSHKNNALRQFGKLYWRNFGIGFMAFAMITPPLVCGKTTGATPHYNFSSCTIMTTYAVSILTERPVRGAPSFVESTPWTCWASEPIGAATYVIVIATFQI